MTDSKRKHIPFKLLFAILVTLILILGFYFVKTARDGLYDEKLVYLKEISTKSATNVQNHVASNLSMLDGLATMMGLHDEDNLETWLPILAKEASTFNFKRMGIVTKDGETLLTDYAIADFSNRQYVLDSFAGKSSVSDSLIDRVDGQYINVFSSPIYKNGVVVAALFGTRSQDQFSQSMELTSFDGEGYMYLINSKGEPIVPTSHPNSMGDYTNLFSSLQEFGATEESLAQMHADITLREDGSFEYIRNDRERSIYYTSVGVNDWYLVTAVPTELISRRSDRLITELIILTCIVLGLIITAFIILQIYSNVQNKKLAQIAYIDNITGYANWEGFKRTAVKLMAENPTVSYAMVLFDVNNFKVVNDVYGHSNGNHLLTRICDILRDVTHEDEAFCRASSDNYNILLKYENDEELIARLNEIERAIEGFIPGYHVVLSFGIYEIGEDRVDMHMLSDRANISKALVKKQGGVRYHFFKDENRAEMLREKEIENIMHTALEQGEFKVYLQPKYSLSSESVVGAEALVRWQHQTQIIMPDEFIPVFEKNGFVRQLDTYMFKNVCQLMAKWQAEGSVCVPISVNISRVHLSSDTLHTELAGLAREYGINPCLLEIELTESAIFVDTEHMIDTMRKIKDLGFLVSLDDFGSGYSSLAALKDLPLDTVKIDKSFLDKAVNDTRGEHILRSIIDMTHALGLECVAEGMETKAQQIFLASAGCDIAQGYYYSRPIPVEQFEQLINSQE